MFIFANKWLRSEFSHRRMMHIIEKLNSGESLGVKEFCTSVGKEWIDFYKCNSKRTRVKAMLML